MPPVPISPIPTVIAIGIALLGPVASAATKLSGTDAFQEAALQPMLRGTWDWKFGKGDKGTISDIILSFDDRLNVVASATIIDGSLRLLPKLPPAPLILLRDTSTGIKSPERGSILIVPMQGIQARPARLLLRSVTDKRIECTDITDTASPGKVVLTKTSDRMIDDVAAAPAALPAPPVAEPVVEEPPPRPATLSERAAASMHPALRRGVLSVFERLKKDQANKPEEKTDAPPEPQVPALPPKFVPEGPRAPVMSLYQRLKTANEQKTAGKPPPPAETPPKPPSLLPPKFVPSPVRTPVMSLYQRLKVEQEKQEAEQREGEEGQKAKTSPTRRP